MKKMMAIAGRVLLAAIVWGLAALTLVRSSVQALEHSRLSRETARLNQEHQQLMDEYGQLLAEGERISGDHDFQVQLLKERFGYTAPDETPIVILNEGEQAPVAPATGE
jgi:hypothetical protein